jgi:hypothetical protein
MIHCYFCLTNLKLSLVIETAYSLLMTELINMMLMGVVGEYCMLQIEDVLLSFNIDNQSYCIHLIYDNIHSRCYLHSVCA